MTVRTPKAVETVVSNQLILDDNIVRTRYHGSKTDEFKVIIEDSMLEFKEIRRIAEKFGENSTNISKGANGKLAIWVKVKA